MKITPTAIRQKTFEVAFRGYEKKEVEAFLDEISEVVDVLHRENMELKTKLQHSEMEAKRLKDVEDSLFRTLKTAEDTGAAIIEEANEAADLIIAEANSTASNATAHVDKMLNDSKQIAEEQAATIIGAAETKAKETIVELRENMSGLVRSYESLVEQREALVKSLRRITQDSLNQIDLSEAHFSRIDGKAYQRAIDELSRSQTFTFANLGNLAPSQAAAEPEVEEAEESNIVAEETQEAHSDTVTQEAVAKQEEEDAATAAKEAEALQEEQEEARKVAAEKAARKAEQRTASTPSEDLNKQSGSFFDQFD